ncbi:MAG TPA: hypothetical protein VFX98_07505 [Longimicrobiaceae bacterium]|nr:hypothetical protein [Longimicrobiaceae bacterium]
MQRITLAAAAVLALGTAACGPRMQPLHPIQPNGAIVPSRSDEAVARAAAAGREERARLAEEQDEVAARALAGCSPAVCDALARGELAVGMTEAQVLAATRSSAAAWETRGGGAVTTLAARDPVHAPADAVAEVAYVTLENGRVRSYAYREPQGYRLVRSAEEAAPEAQARARARALLREGDDFALAGDFVRALDRYDRADVISPDDPETTLRIARALDKQLRPVEALVRWRLFLHQLEIEKIRAYGEVYAGMAAAIAEARSRIIVLERQR